MKALGVAHRLAGMKERFEKRLDAVLAKAEQAEARGEAGIRQQEAYVNNLEQDIAEMEKVMAALGNSAPDPSETPSDGS